MAAQFHVADRAREARRKRRGFAAGIEQLYARAARHDEKEVRGFRPTGSARRNEEHSSR